MPRVARCVARGAATVVELAQAGALPVARAPLCDGAWVEVDPANPSLVTAIVMDDVERSEPFVARLLGISGPIPDVHNPRRVSEVPVEPTAELGRFCRLALANWCLALAGRSAVDLALLIDVGQASLTAGRIGDAAVALDAAADHLVDLAAEFRETPFLSLRAALEAACRDSDFLLGPRNRHHEALRVAMCDLEQDRTGQTRAERVESRRAANCLEHVASFADAASLLRWRAREARRALHDPESPACMESTSGPGRSHRVPGTEGCERPFLHELLAQARAHPAAALAGAADD